jgi:hypothetical protein
MTLLIADERRSIRTIALIGPDHRAAPMVEALQRYRAAGTVSFSTPGHKHGAGADVALRTMLGDSVIAHDVWLNTWTPSGRPRHWRPTPGARTVRSSSATARPQATSPSC